MSPKHSGWFAVNVSGDGPVKLTEPFTGSVGPAYPPHVPPTSCKRNHCTFEARYCGGAVKLNVGSPLVVRVPDAVMHRYRTVVWPGISSTRRRPSGVTPLGVFDENVAVNVVPGGTVVNGKPRFPPKPCAGGRLTLETPLTGAGNGSVVDTANAGTGGNVGAVVPVLNGGRFDDPPWHATNATRPANMRTGTIARRFKKTSTPSCAGRKQNHARDILVRVGDWREPSR
jgi:hypothetical protein